MSAFFNQFYDDNRWISWYQTLERKINLLIYVGIYIAKFNHFTSALSSNGEILIEPFKFTNNNDDFQLLLSKLNFFDKNDLIIGL